MRVLTLTAALALASSPLLAQAGATRPEVQAFVREYAEAANRGDAGAYAAMYHNSPDLILINDGVISRGWASARDEANQILGMEGTYRLSLGVVDVLPMGATRAVAAFPFVLTLQGQNGPTQVKGASTLVLQKIGGKWLIVHDHTSYQGPGE